jgi:hypothetical protein
MFFETIIVNSFHISHSDRAMEPLLMLMSVLDQLSALSVLQLIFFALNVFEKLDGLLDTLVEVLQVRMKEDTTKIVDEAPLVVALCIILLGAEKRCPFHVLLVLSIAEVCGACLSMTQVSDISRSLRLLLAEFSGEDFVAGLFMRFPARAQMLFEQGCTNAILALLRLSALFRLSSDIGH